MSERVINGKIDRWGEIKVGVKKDGINYWHKVSCNIANEWHSFFVDNANKGKEMIESAPSGSEVNFVEWQKEGDQYWNYKKDSFKVISKASPTATTNATNQSNAVPTSANPQNTMTEAKWLEKEAREIRKQCMNNMTALTCQDKLIISQDDWSDTFFKLAKDMEEWIWRGFEPPQYIKNKPDQTPDGQVTEEEIVEANQTTKNATK